MPGPNSRVFNDPDFPASQPARPSGNTSPFLFAQTPGVLKSPVSNGQTNIRLGGPGFLPIQQPYNTGPGVGGTSGVNAKGFGAKGVGAKGQGVALLGQSQQNAWAKNRALDAVGPPTLYNLPHTGKLQQSSFQFNPGQSASGPGIGGASGGMPPQQGQAQPGQQMQTPDNSGLGLGDISKLGKKAYKYGGDLMNLFSGGNDAVGYYSGHPTGGFVPDPSGVHTGHPSGGFAPNRIPASQNPALAGPGAGMATGVGAALTEYMSSGDVGKSLAHGTLAGSLGTINPILGAAASFGLGKIDDHLQSGDKPRVGIGSVNEFQLKQARRPSKAKDWLRKVSVPFEVEEYQKRIEPRGDMNTYPVRYSTNERVLPDFSDMSYPEIANILQKDADRYKLFGTGHQDAISSRYPITFNAGDTGNDRKIAQTLVKAYDQGLSNLERAGVPVTDILMGGQLRSGFGIGSYGGDSMAILGKTDPVKQFNKRIWDVYGKDFEKHGVNRDAFYGYMPGGPGVGG